MKTKSFVVEMFENGMAVARELPSEGNKQPHVVSAGESSKVFEVLEHSFD